ncbi:MAG: hypothetical protein LUC33_03520 [Prevotellaceae bacterium]|nr:hypothetical protein [Prevotellaceae bacterium]
MKRIAYLMMILLLPAVSALGQDDEDNGYFKKRYANISFSKSTLEQGLLSVKSNYGLSLSVGRTFYVTKPLLNILRVGIDATWIDLSYRNYDAPYYDPYDSYDYLGRYYSNTRSYWDYGDYYEDDDDEKLSIHELGIGVQFGPSITINPVKQLDIHAYLRYAPTFAAFYYTDGIFRGGYGSFWTAGLSVTYRFIGLGIEGKFGRTKVGNIIEDDDDDDEDYGYGGYSVSSSNWSKKMKTLTNGFRIYLAFRF